MQIEVLASSSGFPAACHSMKTQHVATKPQCAPFLDYQVVNSDIEVQRDHPGAVIASVVRVLTTTRESRINIRRSRRVRAIGLDGNQFSFVV